MRARRSLRFARLAAAAAAALAALPAVAQEFGFRAGGGARVEYTDNYQLRAFDQVGATTVTVSPFVTGYRRSENSQINLLAGLGYNYVFASELGNDDYWSGRLNLNGSTVQERHSYGFNVGAIRDQTIRTETVQTGVVFGAGSTRTGLTAGANYDYALTERWSAGVFGSVFSNSYDQAQGRTAIQDNDGWNIGANAAYSWSDRTRFTLATTYGKFTSDITDSDSISTTLEVSHQYSSDLRVSLSGGYFWSSVESTQVFSVCPTTPIFCDLGVVAPVQVTTGTEVDSGGSLFGGSLSYRFSERTGFNAGASQRITPSGIGTLTKATNISARLSHDFSERLRGQIGGGWTQSTVPGTDSGTTGLRTEFLTFGASVSYDLTREWLMTAGVRHDESDQRGLTADANVVFLSIAWNWPGQSIGDWGGFIGGFDSAPFPAGAPGAGSPPQAEPGQPLGAPSAAPAPSGETPAQ